MDLQLRFKDLREDHDLSQQQVADIIGCSQQTYSRYEAHVTEMPFESLVRLAAYYETSVDYLLGATKNRKRYPA